METFVGNVVSKLIVKELQLGDYRVHYTKHGSRQLTGKINFLDTHHENGNGKGSSGNTS